MKPLLVGVAGGTGSGKSTFVSQLKKQLDEITLTSVLGLDFYYANNPDLSLEERARINYDHPSAYDFPFFLEQLKLVKDGKAVNAPQYDYSTHLRTDKTVYFEVTPIILVEGILLFHDEDARALLDYKIFIDVEKDIRLIRRLRRDTVERGRSFDSVIEQYTRTVEPMYTRYVEPTKKYADVVVPHGGLNKNAVDLIAKGLTHMLKDRLQQR